MRRGHRRRLPVGRARSSPASAAACGISPKVILVTLQKEQALVNGGTRGTPRPPCCSAPWATPARTTCERRSVTPRTPASATRCTGRRGSGSATATRPAPATTSPGSTRAATGSSTTDRRRAGRSPSYVQNKATAALYYYTPYTPNTAALNNLYGTGDGCSAYGNRNFWRLYSDWFGSDPGNGRVPTTANGSYDQSAPSNNSVTVAGWALDTTTKASTRVRVYGRVEVHHRLWTGTAPTSPRPTPSPGRRTASRRRPRRRAGSRCASTRSPRTARRGGPRVRAGHRAGRLAVRCARPGAAAPGGVAVAGWAIDPETAESLGVTCHLRRQGREGVHRDKSRPDVGRAYPKAARRTATVRQVPSRRAATASASRGRTSARAATRRRAVLDRERARIPSDRVLRAGHRHADGHHRDGLGARRRLRARSGSTSTWTVSRSASPRTVPAGHRRRSTRSTARRTGSARRSPRHAARTRSVSTQSTPAPATTTLGWPAGPSRS